MKKILVILLLCCFFNINAFAFQNEPDGFRGIKWGTDISALPDMEFVRDYTNDFGGIKIYIQKDDELKIGGADVSEIEYFFWRNKFYKVSISTQNLLNSGTLQHSCIDKFGDQIDSMGSLYTWKGPVTKITITEPSYNGNLFWMQSVSITNKLNPLERQRDSERASKGF